MSDTYILDDQGNPVPEPDIIKWARWFEENADKRRVAFAIIGQCSVSTVFLGLDHSWGDGPPLLYETMIFDGEGIDYQERYSTREEALAGHAHACEVAKEQNIALKN